VPPSRIKTDDLYDDRVVQILQKLGEAVDVREVVTQTTDYDPSHGMEVRLGPDDLYELYEIDMELLEPTPTSLVVVDDVLTTGAHFKAMKRILNMAFPEVPLIGVFVARRVPEHL
jgi:predicted amidophosphoribosyltransferase